MEFLKNFDFKPMAILKIAGIALVAIILIILAFSLISSSFKGVSRLINSSSNQMAMDQDMASEEMFAKSFDESMAYGTGGAVSLSTRNVVSESMPPYDPGVVTGDDAEAYEITEYSSTIETGNLDKTCSTVADLKIKDYVIFENSSQYDTGCNYRFKVKHENVSEILSIIKSLDPKELSEDSYTIKRLIDDYTSEVEVLEKKKDSIEATLNDAIIAYDEISNLATRTQDVESLAKIIDSKIRIIERLTSEKILINEQLDRLSRAKAEQLDRLDYTYFNINIYEDKYIDGDNLKDSWKSAIKNFVKDINKTVQAVTINLIALIFVIIQYALYLLIVIIVAKYGWQLIKYIWRK